MKDNIYHLQEGEELGAILSAMQCTINLFVTHNPMALSRYEQQAAYDALASIKLFALKRFELTRSPENESRRLGEGHPTALLLDRLDELMVGLADEIGLVEVG